jgi:tetratricopeptide (TPR) repeat protein
MTTKTFLRCSFGLALAISVSAQSKPPVTGGGGGSTGPTKPSLPSSTSSVPNNSSTSPDAIPRPAYISGKVMMDDGTSPPESVLIQLICSGSPRSVGYTDSKGNFGVDLNNRTTRSLFVDSSDNYSPGRGSGGSSSSGVGSMMNGSPSSNSPFGTSYIGCDVRAALAGFRSDVIHLDGVRALDNPEIGSIILHRLANVEGLTISNTSRLAPKDAQKAFEKGRNSADKKKLEDAQKEFEKAVGIYPKYAAAWYQLGLIQEEQKDHEGARKSWANSLSADGKYVNPYLELAALAMREQKWQEAADATDRLLHLNPVDFPQAWMFNALANYYVKNPEVAEKSARECISRDPNHRYPMMSRLLGVLLAAKEDYAGAATQLRDYLRVAPNARDAETVKKQLAEVEQRLEPETKKQ